MNLPKLGEYIRNVNAGESQTGLPPAVEASLSSLLHELDPRPAGRIFKVVKAPRKKAKVKNA